jgi:hypothetical protein
LTDADLGCIVNYQLHAVQRATQRVDVAHIPLDELDLFRHVLGPGATVHLIDQLIVHPNGITTFQQQLHDVRADKASPAGHKHQRLHILTSKNDPYLGG